MNKRKLTSVFLRTVVVVDLLADAFAFAQVASQIFLLLLVVVTQQLLPVVGIHALLLLDDLPLHLLLLSQMTSDYHMDAGDTLPLLSSPKLNLRIK